MSTRYGALGDALLPQCQASCTPAALQVLTPSNWQCMFQSSCRQTFDADVCHVQASYYCM